MLFWKTVREGLFNRREFAIAVVSKRNWIYFIEFQVVTATDSVKDADGGVKLFCELQMLLDLV